MKNFLPSPREIKDDDSSNVESMTPKVVFSKKEKVYPSINKKELPKKDILIKTEKKVSSRENLLITRPPADSKPKVKKPTKIKVKETSGDFHHPSSSNDDSSDTSSSESSRSRSSHRQHCRKKNKSKRKKRNLIGQADSIGDMIVNQMNHPCQDLHKTNSL